MAKDDSPARRATLRTYCQAVADGMVAGEFLDGGGGDRGEEVDEVAGADPQAERWLRVDLRAERLDWVPAVLASLDRPFVIERPDELRGLVIALADGSRPRPAQARFSGPARTGPGR